jgi:hypothetical protein
MDSTISEKFIASAIVLNAEKLALIVPLDEVPTVS